MFGELVRAHRWRSGLSQEQLAQATGLSVRGIGKLEAGRVAAPRPATVRLLTETFALTGSEREEFCRAATATAPRARRVTATAPATVPAQLPMDIRSFTGRQAELAHLDALLAAGADPPRVAVALISGTPGVGKSALAIRWGHRTRHRFPDGQCYLNLRGYHPDQPVSPGEALSRLLTALGIPDREHPPELDEGAALYRSALASRRMLIVLDNAASADQVRPLLPGAGTCAVLVTSRDRLPGLIALHSADRIDLDLLPAAEAVSLLRQLIGPRVVTEPGAAATLVGQCARLPLALRVAAELALARPDTSLTDLTAELRDQRQRLELLGSHDDPYAAVSVVFSWSLQHLPPAAARGFRLAGLHPGPSLDPYGAAALVGGDVATARRTLRLLARSHLVEPAGAGRYAMHDLLRAYAADLTQRQETGQQQTAARQRLFDYYLAAAIAAMNLLHPADAHRRPAGPDSSPSLPELSGPDTARAWLDSEIPTLVSVAAHTAARGWPTHAVRLAATLYRYLEGSHLGDALRIQHHAYQAAEQTADAGAQAEALRGLGVTHGRMGRYAAAADYFHRALERYRRAGDLAGQAACLENLGTVADRLGQYESALDYVEQALQQFRRCGDPRGEANALVSLGVSEERLGRFPAAAGRYRQALDLFRRVGDRTGEAYALNNLGSTEEQQGAYAAAAGYYRQARELFGRLGHREGEAHALGSLGTLELRRHQPEPAAEHFRRALAGYRTVGERRGEAAALNGLGAAARLADRAAEAVGHHTEALATAVDIGIPNEQAAAHAGLGHAYRRLDEPDRARFHYEQALERSADLRVPEGVAGVRAALAELTPRRTRPAPQSA